MIDTSLSQGRGWLLALVLTVAASPAAAQLAQQAFQVVITRAGHDCQGIERTRALGAGSNTDALVAVACTRGGRHVVAIHTDNSVSYMSACEAFATGTGLVCFDGQSSR
ncbi:hypothetical protein [Allochromatium palmeri]|uniref:Uncharacterized protein n=1 Tax=Allochromatium palmeri TaxID=231048 RepID=A0A6N8EFP3_9GAMM|nr:hypothetical protein [Allochromatium palmeri]MTW23065.1 hypothetical protein [Allochromatium palmeri]